jgi:predicted transcriptional regulator
MTIIKQWSIELKRQHIIQELLTKGVTENKEGKCLYDLTYDELKGELVLQAFREIDVEKDASKWF